MATEPAEILISFRIFSQNSSLYKSFYKIVRKSYLCSTISYFEKPFKSFFHKKVDHVNYRDFYNSTNIKKRILMIDTSEEVISEGEYIANRKEAIHGIAIYYRTSC